MKDRAETLISPPTRAWALIRLPAWIIGFVVVIFAFTYRPPAPQSHAPPTPAASVVPAPKPPPTKADLAKAKAAEKSARAESAMRLGMCQHLESGLLGQGYDVQVTLLSDSNRSMVVIGPGATRLMARQFTASGIGPRLKKAGFVKVIFMQNRYRWIGEWDVFYNTVRLSGG